MSGEYPVAAAIDFGTYGSGFAWTVVSEEDREASQQRILFQERWPGSGDLVYPKTLSALLRDAGGRLVAWGHVARREWRELSISGEREGHSYASAFKMAFTPDHYGDVIVPGLGTVDVNSPAKARPLVVSFLREIRRTALQDIMKSGYQPEDVRWCLTVPAIWDEKQRHLMREVAAEAGLPADGDQLLLAIEPEVAALHCQIHLAHVIGAESKRLDVTRAGNRFIVVDCGGGTVDITAHRADSGPDGRVRLREIVKPMGGPLGSDYINQAFVRKVLAERLGKDTISRLAKECDHVLFDLVDAWEACKVRADVEVDPLTGSPRFQRRVILALTAEFHGVLDEAAKRRLAESQGGVAHRIVLQPTEVQELFDEIVERILPLVDHQLAEVRRVAGPPPGPEQLLLVGGMAGSEYLRQRMAQHAQERAQVLVPVNPAAAVLLGAVHFAYDPSVIRARVAKYTYGCASSMAFDEGTDPEDRRTKDPLGEPRCKGRFSIFVTRDQEVEVDETVDQTFFPMESDQSSIKFSLFRTRMKTPRYVDEPHSKEIGEVEIDISDTLHLPYKKRGVLLRMQFGDTHIKVEAVTPETNRTKATTVRFDSVY